jgi:sugar/nucleoside kinase (ribokinase family)
MHADVGRVPRSGPGEHFDVIGIGENSVDRVYRVPTTPGADSKQRISSHRVSAGGQVATTLCTCAALGLSVRYVGAFGNDEHGRIIREALSSRGVDLSLTSVRPAPNRYAVILVDEGTGQRTVLWDRHAQLALTADDIPRNAIARARVVHVDEVDPDVACAAAVVAREAGVVVTSDIDQLTPMTAQLIASVTVPIMAAHVPEGLTGESDPERALRQLRQPHHRMLCVTLGSRGSMLLEGDRVHHAPAPTVPAVDSTGAGDVFRGAFIYALLRGDTPSQILRFANAAAAISCTRQGAIDAVPSLTEVERLLLSS